MEYKIRANNQKEAVEVYKAIRQIQQGKHNIAVNADSRKDAVRIYKEAKRVCDSKRIFHDDFVSEIKEGDYVVVSDTASVNYRNYSDLAYAFRISKIENPINAKGKIETDDWYSVIVDGNFKETAKTVISKTQNYAKNIVHGYPLDKYKICSSKQEAFSELEKIAYEKYIKYLKSFSDAKRVFEWASKELKAISKNGFEAHISPSDVNAIKDKNKRISIEIYTPNIYNESDSKQLTEFMKKVREIRNKLSDSGINIEEI